MNAEQRKKLETHQRTLSIIRSDIESIKDENQDAFDNMPEGLQNGEKGEVMNTAISALEDALSDLENVDNNLETAIAAKSLG